MTTVQQLYEAMQRIAPLELAESWDNPGLLVDCGGEVTRVLVTLDITPEVVTEAAAKHCEAIVAHHPVIFDPLKKLGRRMCRSNWCGRISAICMHTNLDAAAGGVNEVLAGIFGMQDRSLCRGLRPGGSIEPSRAAAGPQGTAGAGRPLQCTGRRPGGAGQICRHRQTGAAAGRHQRRRRKPV